jgi:hypothetical protein
VSTDMSFAENELETLLADEWPVAPVSAQFRRRGAYAGRRGTGVSPMKRLVSKPAPCAAGCSVDDDGRSWRDSELRRVGGIAGFGAR